MEPRRFFVGRAIGFIVVVAVAAVAWLVYSQFYAPPQAEPVFCTADAMQCPDGSWVGRTGPNCEFVCPAATTTPGGGGGGGGGGILPYQSGIRGIVMAGPTCPVERYPADPQCVDKPIETNIWISRKGNPQVILSTASNKQGQFEASLPPGEYVVQAGSSGLPFPSCINTPATVGPDTYTAIEVSCDTGIR